MEHIGRHEAPPEETEDVFDYDPVFRKRCSGYHCVYGRTDAGRYLFVVLCGNQAGLEPRTVCKLGRN